MHTDSPDTVAPELNFQHYKVLRLDDGSPWELGRGSMGITYKAFDVNLCCEVALKVINAATLEHPHARERFVSEARAAARLRHRNIASVYHLGNDGEHYFYAMEFVDGETLDALVRRQGPLPVAAALKIVLQAARALAAATRQGLVHRDLKPANLMVTHEDDDDEPLVKVIDFGLAKPISHADGASPLTFGGFVGTPQFASPEQLEERPVDGRSDIYSLGATAWFLLTGRAPFLGSLAAICRQHLTQPPPWSQLPKPFPEIVRTLLAQMLEKDPAHRPADAVELRRRAEASLGVLREAAAGQAAALGRPTAKGPSWVRPRLGRPVGMPAAAEAEAPRTGMILKGRYELLRLVGEGNSGRVFLARDRGANEALAAIKILHPELVGTPAERDRLGDEVRLVQAAAHPQLTRVAAMDTLLSQDTVFLVEEWLHGFTVLDFLAVRGGALSVGEGLRLVEQAAAAADHAESRRLERVDFALHQLHLHFPAGSGGGEDDPDGARAPLQTAMAQWPTWILKVNPLGTLRKGLEASTWAGDVTLIPGSGAHAPATRTTERNSAALRDQYTRGVAQLTYELLGGAPASPVYAAERQAKYVSLPALSEEANAVLQRTLTQASAYANAADFHAAIVRAAGSRSAAPRTTGGLPAMIAAPLAGPLVRPTPPIRADFVEGPVSGDHPALSPAPEHPGVVPPRASTTFGVDGEALRGDAEEAWAGAGEERGSVWDRLALVAGEGASRLWVGGVALSFALLLVGVIVFLRGLDHRPALKPSREVAASKPSKANGKLIASTNLTTGAGHHAASLPSPAAKNLPPTLPTPAPSARPQQAPTPPPSTDQTPAALPTTVPAVEVAEASPLPLNPALHDTAVRVRVTSRPAGVEVLSKGKVLGYTPFDVTLPAGDYQLVARYRGWPEIHQPLHLSEGQANVGAELHMMPPTLVPAAASATPISRAQRAQQDEVVRRNFVRSTRGSVASGNADPAATPAAGDADSRRAAPKLHPFDPNGAFRPTSPGPVGD